MYKEEKNDQGGDEFPSKFGQRLFLDPTHDCPKNQTDKDHEEGYDPKEDKFLEKDWDPSIFTVFIHQETIK